MKFDVLRLKVKRKWFTKDSQAESCAHERCPKCHGTGVDSRGNTCIHYISCRCPRCRTHSM